MTRATSRIPETVIKVRGLRNSFGDQVIHEGLDLDVCRGEILGVVGESGSGKSVTMLALMGLVAYPGRVRADKLRFDGRDLLTMSARERRHRLVVVAQVRA